MLGYIFYMTAGLLIILLMVIVFLWKKMSKLKEAEKLWLQSKEELIAIHEELAASEEELRQNFNELYTSEEKLRDSEEIYRLVAEGSNDGLWVWNIADDVRTLSERTQEILGASNIGVINTERWQEFVHPEDLPKVLLAMEGYLTGKNRFYCTEYRVKVPGGGYKWILARGKALFDAMGQPVRIAGSYTDITEKKYQEQKINHMAYYDSLTGLANRQLLGDRIAQELDAAKMEGASGAILFIDIDNFKLINDTYGHSWGDKVLVDISSKIMSLVWNKGLAARLGGDEIVILLPKITAAAAEDYVGQLLKIFEQPIIVNDSVFHITASAGVVMYPENGDNVDDLLRNVDTAMYSAKTSGKRQYKFFDKSMHEAVVEKSRLEANLRKAIEMGELRLHYQPQFAINTGKITGCEALLRWESKEYGMVAPDKFIPLAEETGLIIAIGKWVLKEACLFSQHIFQEQHRRIQVAINISVVQLRQEDFVEMVAGILAATHLPPHYLELEITESLLMECFDENVRKLNCLREMGIKIALDDFGSGYSSLTYLKKLPIGVLKIDKAFIDDIDSGGLNSAITGSIIELAHLMELAVVAEGVETAVQMEYLREHNCDMIQGYLISRPLTAQDFVQFIIGK